MAETTHAPKREEEDGVVPRPPSPSPILGQCVLRLSRITTYEPPLYLFPELLPPVPQGTPPLPVWDAVADAVDIAASSSRLADASQLLAGAARQGNESTRHGKGTETMAGRAPTAMVTLASMVAENRLLPAGIDATALRRDAFSAADVIRQLGLLKSQLELSDEEGAAVMSNHFINLLAWQKLREINEVGGHRNGISCSGAEHTEKKEGTGSSSGAEEDEECEALLASPNPWATDTEMAKARSDISRFVSASEANVEGRVELLRTLSKLYQRPWRTLASHGQQTDFVMPPGTANVTSPYADHSKVPGAMLDPMADLDWGHLAAASTSSRPSFGSLQVLHTPCFFSVVISSRREPGSTATATVAEPLRVPLWHRATSFGRSAGVQPAAAVAAAASVDVSVGLAPFTSHPELISLHHFTLLLRPVYDRVAVGGITTVSSPPTAKQEDVEEDEEEYEEEDAREAEGTRRGRTAEVTVHTKTPDHYTLWLVNYSRNGVRLPQHGWVFGSPRELFAGDVLQIGGNEVELGVEQHTTAAAACAPVVTLRSPVPLSAGVARVKREREEEVQ